MLTSVSGVGAQTARMILSGLGPRSWWRSSPVAMSRRLKAVKGIGAKTAQRILVDLQDKMGKDPSFSGAPSLTGVRSGSGNEFAGGDNTARSDALAALCNLGFDRRRVESVLDQTHRRGSVQVEELVRAALKRL